MGAFSAKFSMTLAAKLLMGPKNFLDLQCWHGPPLYHAKFGGNRTTYSAWEDEVWCFSLCLYFLKITLSAFDYFGAYSWVTSTRHIAPAFVGQFRWCLHHSFSDEKHFQPIEQFSKLSLGGATIGARKAEQNENLRKWVKRLLAPLRPFISEVKENYYHSVLPYVTCAPV